MPAARPVRPRGELRRVVKPVQEAVNPNGSDSSSPKFADDILHFRRILAAHGHGFPWIAARI